MSLHGSVTAIYVTAEATAPMTGLTSVRAVAGAGLDGDRYARGAGTWSAPDRPEGQVTLIESEATAAVTAETGTPLDPAETRRNLVTEGVALNHLVGREFRVGGAVLRGVRLCEPCTHLEGLAGKPVRKPLVHRGGLNAIIVEGGTIAVGDSVREAKP